SSPWTVHLRDLNISKRPCNRWALTGITPRAEESGVGHEGSPWRARVAGDFPRGIKYIRQGGGGSRGARRGPGGGGPGGGRGRRPAAEIGGGRDRPARPG